MHTIIAYTTHSQYAQDNLHCCNAIDVLYFLRQEYLVNIKVCARERQRQTAAAAAVTDCASRERVFTR